MKKILLCLLVLISVCACSAVKEETANNAVENLEDYSKLTIVTPTGAPSLGFLNYIDSPTFETNSTVNNILSMMTSTSSKQVVVIDTISGIKAINKGAPYKLAANLTFGNFYIASCGNDDNSIMDKGDRIVLFGQGTTPDVIFHYLYGNEFDEGIEYVAAVSDAGKCLAAGKNFETGNEVNYVFIAEPILTTILNNKEVPTYSKAGIYANIQEIYREKTGKNMIQASMFVKSDGSIKDIDSFYNYFSNNINSILTDPGYVETLLENKSDEEVSSIYGIKPAMIKNVLTKNTVGLGFIKAYDNKESIDEFISLFNLEKTNEEIYFK